MPSESTWNNRWSAAIQVSAPCFDHRVLTNSITRITPTLLAFFSDHNAAEIRLKNNFFLSAAINATYQQAQRSAVGRLLALAFGILSFHEVAIRHPTYE